MIYIIQIKISIQDILLTALTTGVNNAIIGSDYG